MSSEAQPEVADTCAECGGACCSFKSIRISYLSLDEGQRYDSLLIDGADELVRPDGSAPDMKWYVGTYPDGERSLFFHCEHLEDGICTAYEQRPEMCRSFECPALEGEEELDEFIRSVSWRSDPVEGLDLRDVTERATGIIERHGEPWDPEAEHDE